MKASFQVGLKDSIKEFGNLLHHYPDNDAVISILKTQFELVVQETFEQLDKKLHKTTFDVIPQDAKHTMAQHLSQP